MDNNFILYLISLFLELVINFFVVFMILKMGLNNLWIKAIISSALAIGVTSLYSFYFVTAGLEAIRIIVNCLSVFLIIKVVFKFKWLKVVEIVILLFLFSVLIAIIENLILKHLYNLDINQTFSQGAIIKRTLIRPIAFAFVYPGRLLSNLINYLIIRLKENLKSRLFRFLVLIVFLQTFIVITFGSQIALDTLSVFVQILILITILINVWLIVKVIQFTEERITKSFQDTISENITSMIDSLKGQRHDFSNHLQVLNALYYSGNFEDMEQFLAQLTKETSFVNEVLKTDNIIIGALLNAKLAQAIVSGIYLEININASLSNLSSQAFDISRILGNLLNNAMEAVLFLEENNKRIIVNIEEKGPFTIFSIANYGVQIQNNIETIFTPGFTTKGENHSGLGLYTCQQLAIKLHGKIDYKYDNLYNIFSLIIPKK